MIRYLLTIIFLFLSIHARSQTLKPNALGLDYYTQGTEHLKNGQYKLADSILTIALRSFKNENVYFNRAFSRINLNDTIGFCEDINLAANRYFDVEAGKYFDKFCCSKVDTIFYDRKRLVTEDNKYRYYEIIKKEKYNTNTLGTFHDKKSLKTRMSVDFGIKDELIGAYGTQTNIIASYVIDKRSKYYISTTKSASIINTRVYDDLIERAQKYLNSKFGYLKEKNNVKSLRVYFSVYFNSQGRVYHSEYLGFYPEIKVEFDSEELEKVLLNIAKKYPRVEPAKFFKKQVSYLAYDFLEF